MKHGVEIKSIPELVRVIELLLFLPEFQSKVTSIRENLKITPEIVNKERLKLLGKANFRALQITEKAADELDFDLSLQVPVEQQSELLKKTSDWERKRFPTLDKRVGELRLKEFGGIPLSWSGAIKNYILYGRIINNPFLSRKSSRLPTFYRKIEPDTLEPYVEIKIYGDTDIRFLAETRTLEKIQKELPTFRELTSKTNRIAYRRLLYYYLREVEGKTHSEAEPILKRHGFKPIDYQYASQEIERFAELLKTTKK